MNAPFTHRDARIEAEVHIARLEAWFDQLRTSPDTANARIHCLFAELYVLSAERWMARLDGLPEADLGYRLVAEFFRLYDGHVMRNLNVPIPHIAPHWRLYHRLARRVTMRSPISVHLALISLAARAHVRHDLGPAMAVALRKEAAQSGRRFNQEQVQTMLFGVLSDASFYGAALDFIALHRAQQRGWRRTVLTLWSRLIRLLRPVWLPVLQSWRRAALAESLNSLPSPTKISARG